MRFFSPTEAPDVHIEILPDQATAVESYIDDGKLLIGTWAAGPNIPCRSAGGLDEFQATYCDDCRLYSDSIEIDMDGMDTYDSELGDITIADSRVVIYSPCCSHSDGLSEVSFPCRMGFEPSDLAEESDIELSAEYMHYSVTYNFSSGRREFFACQQPLTFYKDQAWTEGMYTAINTYERDNRICWGELTTPFNLLQAEAAYSTSYANEDLCSFDTHSENTDDIKTLAFPEDYWVLENVIPIDTTIKRPKAAICAPASQDVSSFMLLATAGATCYGPLAYVVAYLYKNVAIDDDTVMDVWATEVMPVGRRLLFISNNKNEMINGMYIGQVESNFNLSPCELIQPPSSEQAEQDSKLSPA